ncbi:FAD-dependent monooxygenase [Streptosporangium sp. 'caverna']|uniref:FAD-dependent monooxygenase n=1 Tax=Streptosporangium sp. 'caverna' TaxID=2202249 RepID=UPI000D7D4B40|nr:FAD-dependent monooxygenase [Streptosporangium sp. 'caverna']AWS48524.1 monooxygenase [Streptosporangium sp. 'caverna']
MSPRSVLISGGGIAGLTLSYWLAHHGFHPTVVERSRGLRSSGSPVDVRGPALPVAEEMGIMPGLRDVATQATTMSVVNAAGRQVARMAMPATSSAAGNREVELPRGDLAAVLYRAARDDAEFLFDDTIVTMRQDEHGVDVTFDRSAPRRFDLVVGADGLHSTVRRLAFGPEPGFVRHMGVYVATMPLDGPVDHPHDVLMYNTPGRLVSIHPSRGRALAAFIFRGPAITDFDHRDTEQHRRIVTKAYAGAGWRVPQLLERLQRTEDLYFDSVSQVRLPTWAQGRVALLGDAASCVSLFGDGSSLAMAGAHTLAKALATQTADPAGAFRRYETEHRTLVGPKQRNIGRAVALLIPRTRLGIAARNIAARVWLSRR